MDFWNAKSCLSDFLKPPRHFQILSEFLFLIKAPPVSASSFTYIRLVHSVPDMKLLTIFYACSVSFIYVQVEMGVYVLCQAIAILYSEFFLLRFNYYYFFFFFYFSTLAISLKIKLNTWLYGWHGTTQIHSNTNSFTL